MGIYFNHVGIGIPVKTGSYPLVLSDLVLLSFGQLCNYHSTILSDSSLMSESK